MSLAVAEGPQEAENASPVPEPDAIIPQTPERPSTQAVEPATDGKDSAAEAGETNDKGAIWNEFEEQYKETLTELPAEYKRILDQIREYEDEQQTSTENLKTAALKYIESLSAPTPAAEPSNEISQEGVPPATEGVAPVDEANEGTATAEIPKKENLAQSQKIATNPFLEEITKTADAAIKAGEDKLGLAITLYESVDRHIRRLDNDLLKIADEIVLGLRADTQPSHEAPSAQKKEAPGATTSLGAIALGEKEAYDEQGGATEGALKRRERPAAGALAEPGRKRLMNTGSTTILGPIDPNEPTYCFCDRVSFGEMVGCENDDCKREWFHFECVGLTAAPLEKWWCRECEKSLGVGSQKPPDPKKRKR